MSLERLRVVLVRTQFPGNLGATARVMRNLGFSDLVLVDPLADREAREARRLSAHGEAILERARVCRSLDEALGGCGLVCATGSDVGGVFRRQTVGRPVEISPHLVDQLVVGRAALVFGPERTGLSDEEIRRCHYLMRAATDPKYPSLNLAQAAAICLYAVRECYLERSSSVVPAAPGQEPAAFAEQERMFADLKRALQAIGYLRGGRQEALMHAVRFLIARARPSRKEVTMLWGLARQIEWYVRQAPRHDSGNAAVEAALPCKKPPPTDVPTE